MNLNHKTIFSPKNVHIHVAYLECPLFKTYHFSNWNDITVSLKTKYEMNILFNTHTYILYIHTTAVNIKKMIKIKYTHFTKSWLELPHQLMTDIMMSTLNWLISACILTQMLFYIPHPQLEQHPFHILCISCLVWLKNTNLCCTVFLKLCSVVITSSPARMCYWSLRFCLEFKNL